MKQVISHFGSSEPLNFKMWPFGKYCLATKIGCGNFNVAKILVILGRIHSLILKNTKNPTYIQARNIGQPQSKFFVLGSMFPQMSPYVLCFQRNWIINRLGWNKTRLAIWKTHVEEDTLTCANLKNRCRYNLRTQRNKGRQWTNFAKSPASALSWAW